METKKRSEIESKQEQKRREGELVIGIVIEEEIWIVEIVLWR